MAPPKSSTKPAAKKAVKSAAPAKASNPLFVSRPKNNRVGGDLRVRNNHSVWQRCLVDNTSSGM